jgi:hypothetical protein
MVPDQLKTRAPRVIEEIIINQGDLAIATELISPDCVRHVPGGPSIATLTARPGLADSDSTRSR